MYWVRKNRFKMSWQISYQCFLVFRDLNASKFTILEGQESIRFTRILSSETVWSWRGNKQMLTQLIVVFCLLRNPQQWTFYQQSLLFRICEKWVQVSNYLSNKFRMIPEPTISYSSLLFFFLFCYTLNTSGLLTPSAQQFFRSTVNTASKGRGDKDLLKS